MYIKRVERAIQSIKNGEIIIIMDDEDRENEADLVMAGIFSNGEKINFMAKEARGLICASITKSLSTKLNLPLMVQHNNSNHETAFTISIDAKEAKTGISAFERSLTIKLLCDQNSTEFDFVRPGHIFPLIAKEGGVLVRTGHTEASIDICKLAGVEPVAVICELMKEDGSMPGNGDNFINEFAKKHNLNILYVSDIVQYRLMNEGLVHLKDSKEAEFLGCKCIKHTFLDHLNHTHTVYSFDFKKIPLVRFHKKRNELNLLEDMDTFGEFLNSFKLIKEEGGYLVCLHDSMIESKDSKTFGIGAQILGLLNVESFKLVSNSNLIYIALSGFNLDLVERIPIDKNLII